MEKAEQPGTAITSRRALAVALVLPALVYLAIAWVMPSQYRFVIVDAAQRGWPLVNALAAMILYLFILLWMLRGAGVADRRFAMLAATPLVAALLSILVAAGRSPGAWLAAGAALALLAALFRYRRRHPDGAMPPRLRSIWLALASALVVYFGFGAASLAEPLALPRAMGALAILAIFMGTLAAVLCAIALSRRFALGFGALCLLAVFLFDTNNHAIPVVRAKAEPKLLDDAFSQWLASRRDLDAYRSRGLPYPVILVSSEGGGIYAAAHAYGTLSTIARNCPTFSQHVFAVVGVSGGAMGNVLFAGATDPEQKPYTPCRPGRGKVDPAPVIADHLSPVLARMLFAETVDQLVPGQWVARDRAQILTDSFLSVAADKAHAASALTDSFDPQGARPALISVATDVEAGTRLIMSPFQPEQQAGAAEWWPGSANLFTGEESDHSRQISVVNAAGLSARFPWVTPTGLLQVADGSQRIVADGGYFDNSGADTVTDLVDGLNFSQNARNYWRAVDAAAPPDAIVPDATCSPKKVRVVRYFHEQKAWEECEIPVFIVYLALASSEPMPAEESGKSAVHKAPRQSFLGDPLKVLLSTRGSRGEGALRYADLYYCGMGAGLGGSECAAEPGRSFGMFRNDVHPGAWQLPLGWFMSRGSFDAILKGTVNDRYFDYRRHRDVFDAETELMIYHLDPALYDEGAVPGIGDLMGGP